MKISTVIEEENVKKLCTITRRFTKNYKPDGEDISLNGSYKCMFSKTGIDGLHRIFGTSRKCF